MKECLIKNLCDGPRDYPMSKGNSIYLGVKCKTTIPAEEVSEAMKLAESKGLLLIEDIPSEEGES